MKRAILIVIDSLGIGAMPDAKDYGDKGANTLGHIAKAMADFRMSNLAKAEAMTDFRIPNLEESKAMTDFRIPNLVNLGLGCIDGVEGIQKVSEPLGAYGRMAEKSNGKDTITGHWELAGLYTKNPFQTFPDGFPSDFMRAFEEAIGRKTLGNYAASGTKIIEELGPEHERTGSPIIYTSADSVFQIAANTAIIPLEELYRICEIAREMLVGEVQVARVIARPYVIENGRRIRTSERKDYAVSPTAKTMLDHVKDGGKTVYTVGKISDIFNGQGVTNSVHTDSNMDGVDKTLEAIGRDFTGLIFTNLVDFDSKYGHRRDAVGYGKALEEFDARLPEIMGALRDQDILILCADHGNDPGHIGWDHTREYVPLLVYGKDVKPGVNLGTRQSFADVGATVTEYLDVEATEMGESFLGEIV